MNSQIVTGDSATQPYLWRIVAADGQTLAVSENSAQKASAGSAVESVITNAAGASIEDLSPGVPPRLVVVDENSGESSRHADDRLGYRACREGAP